MNRNCCYVNGTKCSVVISDRYAVMNEFATDRNRCSAIMNGAGRGTDAFGWEMIAACD